MSSPSPFAKRVAFVVASVVIVGALATTIALRRRAAADEISPRRFASDKLPAVTFAPPEGWQLEWFEKEGRVIARKPGASASVETVWLNGPVEPQAIVQRFASGFQSYGYEIGPTFSGAFQGLDALGLTATSHTQKTAAWVVKRGERLVANVVCTFEAREVEPRAACKDLFSTLEWRTPVAGAR